MSPHGEGSHATDLGGRLQRRGTVDIRGALPTGVDVVGVYCGRRFTLLKSTSKKG